MSSDYSDQKILLKKIQKSDLTAFKYLYETSRNRLYVLAYSITGDEEASRDLIQDFFIDFWKTRKFENITSSLYAYLYRSVRNRAYNYLDKERTLAKLKNNLPDPQHTTVSFDRLEQKELHQTIHLAIDQLPQKARTVFEMQYIRDFSQAEIAENLGISRHTVSNHIQRALKELREKLKKNL